MLPGYLTYQLSYDSSFYIVTGFVGAEDNISIPHIYDALPVFGIMANAFKNNTTLKSISMPNSIQEIGSYAFAGCTALESVSIPTSVKSIFSYTFSGCTSLKTITLHSGIETIGSYAFEKCSSLKNISLNDGLLNIYNNAFDYCTSLESISIPDTVTSLGSMAFRHAESLKSVKFSSALESIGNATFQNCVSLESIELHENINTLGSSTFSYCDSLKSIRILGNITNIGTATFYECRNIESVYYASKTAGDAGNTNYIFYNAGVEGSGITLTLAKDSVVPDGLFTPYFEDNLPKITSIVIEDGSTKVNGFTNYNSLPYLESITYPESIEDVCYGIFNNSLWWDTQVVGEVFISNIFYGYKCLCDLSSPLDAVEENRTESTCISDGRYEEVVTCEVCLEELSRKEIIIPKKLYHDYGDFVIDRAPTSTEDGAKSRTCSWCNYTETVPYLICSTCSGDGKVNQKVDCSSCYDGYSYEKCSVCYGRGKIQSGYARCSLCGGSGRYVDAFGRYQTCMCGGDGVVITYETCYYCSGKGSKKDGYCSRCSGNEYIYQDVNCENCDASGYYLASTIHYSAGEEITVPNDYTLTGTDFTISTTVPKKEGYHFIGWILPHDSTTIYNPGENITVVGHSVLYAVWAPDCSECDGVGYFTKGSTCGKCGGDGSYYQHREYCGNCGSSYIVGIITGVGINTRYCNTCGSMNVKSNSTYTNCTSCKDGIVNTSTNCTECNGKGYIS